MKKYVLAIIISIIIFLGIIGFIYKDEISRLFSEETNTEKENETENKPKDPYLEYKKIPYFKQENLNRYLAYQEKNKELSIEQIITYVNIGLDYEFYSYIQEADMSKGYQILTNKYLKLPSTYEPDDLEEISSKYFISGNAYVRKMRHEAKVAFEALSEASIANQTPVYGQSAYREYEKQEKLYQNAVSEMGQQKADNDTARPGHSEHQTGLTIDVSSTKAGNMLVFEKTTSYTWMQNNAHKYGFILRYPKDYENIHGFMYESWHYRYVGVEVATDMHDNYPNLTYDEYYYQNIDK